MEVIAQPQLPSQPCLSLAIMGSCYVLPTDAAGGLFSPPEAKFTRRKKHPVDKNTSLQRCSRYYSFGFLNIYKQKSA